MAADQELYGQRQAIVEHPFGTIRRQWGFEHIMTKKYRARASAAVRLIFIAYNLRRITNVLADYGRGNILPALKQVLTGLKIPYKVSSRNVLEDSRF